MHARPTGALTAVFLSFALASRLLAADAVSLAGNSGAVAAFTSTDAGWNWTGFTIPGRTDVQPVQEMGYEVDTTTGTDSAPAAVGWTLTENSGTRLVFEHAFANAGVALRRVYTFGPADNVLRLETWARALSGPTTLKHASLLSADFPGNPFQETGIANQSFPLFAPSLFVGIEHVSGECHAFGECAYAAQTPWLALNSDWTFVTAVVVGWPVPNADLAPGQSAVRGAFLHYLDTVRIKPKDMELHTNTWWTLPLPFSEQDVLNDIDALRQGFYERTGMFFDSYALDLGWSDRHSVWQVDEQRFPNSFNNIVNRLGAMGCKLGLWVSPGSAYPEGLDNAWLKSSGYNVTPSDGPDGVVACFAKGGNYQQALKQNIVAYAQQFGLGHVKLDYMSHTCDVASHGHPTDPSGSFYAIDAGLADVLDSLRAVNPNMALEPLVCGYPPSPWWTMHTPYMLGPDGDDVPSGRVPSPEWIESLITGRDIAYRAEQEKWIMPTQALETFDIVVQCPGEFENMAVMAIGRGRWFISTYLKPDYMKPTDWDFLAGLVRWARANKQYLVNAQMFGGDPANREAYGYVFHTPTKDIYCIRNPWLEQRTIQLPDNPGLSETRDLKMLYPRHNTLTRIKPGAAAPKVTLAPYETVMLETVPTSSKNKIYAQPARPTATASGATVKWAAGADGSTHYTWDGTVTVPDVGDAELCILVQGDPTVSKANCSVTLSGEAVTPAKSGSEGQFFAAASAPEHWTWFRTPVTAGTQAIHIDVAVPLATANVGVYLRGTTTPVYDTTAAVAPAFPEFHPDRKAWSQAISSSRSYVLKVSAKTR